MNNHGPVFCPTDAPVRRDPGANQPVPGRPSWTIVIILHNAVSCLENSGGRDAMHDETGQEPVREGIQSPGGSTPVATRPPVVDEQGVPRLIAVAGWWEVLQRLVESRGN